MRITRVSIKNFRKLSSIEFDSNYPITTIVGPNGVGKSSILEAIRICKSIVAPSQDHEAQNTLQAMGLLSPFATLLSNNLISDKSKPLKISMTFCIGNEELQQIRPNLSRFYRLRLRNLLGGMQISEFDLANYLTTDQGKLQLDAISKDTESKLKLIEDNPNLDLEFTLTNQGLSGGNGFNQEIIRFILTLTKYSESKFTIFPADRSFPTGDTPIQIGQGDVAQQIQSYSINPQLKFQRLKTVILTQILLRNGKLEEIKEIFNEIFEVLLPGKQLEGVILDEISGKLSVQISEQSSGASYDIDYLSSGEKGLLLTLFLIRSNQANDSIVIIDEPELHLNPAVCKNIIKYLKEKVCNRNNIQIILTTHSAEMLSATKEDQELRLLHLIDGKTISPIYSHDDSEAAEALKFLGVHTSELLFNKGIIYVEGPTDEMFLSELLKSDITEYKIKSVGGRTRAINEIDTLIDADNKGQLNGNHLFIIDNDNASEKIRSSKRVKMIQWDRYSFENYLLNENILYDVVRKYERQNFSSRRSEFLDQIKSFAMNQIRSINILQNLDSYIKPTASISARELQNHSIAEIANIVANKMDSHRDFYTTGYNREKLIERFNEEISQSESAMMDEWQTTWKAKCRGKNVISDIYTYYGIKIKYQDFIYEVIESIRENKSEEFTVVKSTIQAILNEFPRQST